MTDRERGARDARSLHAATTWLLARLALTFAVCTSAVGCSKSAPPPPTVEPKAAAPATPPKPDFDRQGAEDAMYNNVWQGVVGGKPMVFIANRAKDGRLIAGIELDKKLLGAHLTLKDDGQLVLQTAPRPAAGGAIHLVFAGRINRALTEISGTAEQVHKAGFVEQSTGIGDFQLKRGITRAELEAQQKAAKEAKEKQGKKGKKRRSG